MIKQGKKTKSGKEIFKGEVSLLIFNLAGEVDGCHHLPGRNRNLVAPVNWPHHQLSNQEEAEDSRHQFAAVSG